MSKKSENLKNLSRDRLEGMLLDFAKNWLAHDGLWFQAVEKHFGLDSAIDLDAEAWALFTRLEARRIMKRHEIPPDGGLQSLKTALGYRMYAILNVQEISEETDNSFVFKMVDCRVQAARKRKNLELFPCKTVGLAEYSEFAKTIDGRIKTECIACPPDAGKRDFYCGWKFSIQRQFYSGY